MGKIVAYLRASTDKQDLSHQKLEILEFARRHDLRVAEFIEVTVSSHKTGKQRRIDEMVGMLGETDMLIVTELSRLGRSTAEVIDLVNLLVRRNIRVVAIKQNLDIAGKQSRAACGKGGMFSMPLRSRRHRAGSPWGTCKVQRSGVSRLRTMNPGGVRVERGRRRPPEGQSSALAGTETCWNRFQTRPPGTPFSGQDMNSKVIITLFSLFAELERDLISLRTKEALAAKKAQGKLLGKPKGTLQKSKFDKDVPRIRELLGYGLSVRKIAKFLGYTSHIALNTYINKRGLQVDKPKDA